ncbi:MAG TPA: diguanylate cyclase [Gemmataceae bacterium]|nr:diguanylate cyclase [Gemmataceae bacterium]
MSTHKCSLLVVDDEAYLLPPLSALLANDFEVLTAESAEAAQRVLAARPIDIILTDQKMPRMTGVQLLEWVRHQSPSTVRLLMTGYAEHEDAVEAINRGQVYYYLLKPWRIEELLQILRNAAEKFQLERRQEDLLEELRQHKMMLERHVAERTRELEEANVQLQRALAEMEKLALTDPLTGLLNRRAVEDIANGELRRHSRYRGHLAMGIIDVDHFKHINDTHLYPGGDYVLVHLTRVLSGLLRTVDSIGRIGGEEFLVVAPETTVEGARKLAERIRAAVEEASFLYNGKEIPVTVSVGFAVAGPDSPADYKRMKLLASQTVHEAKEQGRNRTVIRGLETLPGGRETDVA